MSTSIELSKGWYITKSGGNPGWYYASHCSNIQMTAVSNPKCIHCGSLLPLEVLGMVTMLRAWR